MEDWITYELTALKKWWTNLLHNPDGNWILLRAYTVPDGWGINIVDIAFKIPDNYPGERPYAFWVKGGLLLPNGSLPASYALEENVVPFEGQWGKFSWELDPWQPGESIGRGTGMVDFAQSFQHRLKDIN